MLAYLLWVKTIKNKRLVLHANLISKMVPKLLFKSDIEFTESIFFNYETRWRTTKCYALKSFTHSQQIVKLK